MTSTTHRCDCSAAPAILYVSFEMGAKEWLLTMGVGPDSKRQRTRVRPGDGAQLKLALDAAKRRFGLPSDAPVRSCYEAGRDGFWPHRWLDQRGVVNLVVDSSSIEVSRRARQAKSDRLDGEKLLRMLFRYWGGERDVWHVVRVPTREAEDERHASRRLTTLQQERTRFRNRIHSLLMLHGVARLRIDEKFPARLGLARDWAGELLPPGVQARVLETWQLLQAVETARRALRRAERERVTAARTTAAAMAQRLTQLRGIAVRTATVLGDELYTRDLRNRREVGGLTGYVSAPYHSGETHHDQGLTRSGLPAIRRLGVQLAWAWVRYQPDSALTKWYWAKFGHGGDAMRRLGIVALARRLLIALWRYVNTGIVPPGAQRKACA